MKLTSQERIMRVFENKPYDRPVLKLWGAFPRQRLLHPDYKCVSDRAALLTDIFTSSSSPFNVYAGQNYMQFISTEDCKTSDPLYIDRITNLHTPEGDLRSVERISKIGDPKYTLEHMVKKPEDLKRILSLPYSPFPLDMKRYEDKKNQIGKKGIVMYDISHPMCQLYFLVGSQNLALFSYDCRNLIKEVLDVFSRRIMDHVKEVLALNHVLVFSWVGPEACIPPLMTPRDFQEFIYNIDKPLCDLIHNAGSYVWVHCHGKVAQFIEPFIKMGVDVLNPLEPDGKGGDVKLRNMVSSFRNRIGMEGNIEIQDILELDTDTLKALIHQCVEEGAPSGRFILCPSAGYMEYARPERRYIQNLMTFIEYGFECVEAYRQ